MVYNNKRAKSRVRGFPDSVKGRIGMGVVFEHWKYIFKNLWFVLPFAVMPALFLALSIDFTAIEMFIKGFFKGEAKISFVLTFRAFSLFRFHTALGIIYSVCAIFSVVVFQSLLLSFVEKHMRIGKRTLSGVFPQLKAQWLSVVGIVLFSFCLYELWALVLSAMVYTVSALGTRVVAYFLFVLLIVIFLAVLIYITTMFYLWLPCMQISGMRAYSALLYSYRLMVGVRGRLFLSFASSLIPVFAALWASALLPTPATVAIAFLLLAAVFLSFSIRMETLYFRTDKIDREDILRGYREL